MIFLLLKGFFLLEQMQRVTAFSAPQTVPPVPASAPKRSLWILDGWRDLILYVGTPLLLVPMLALAQVRWSFQSRSPQS